MRRFWLAVALVTGICGSGQAQTIVPATAAQGLLCRSAVAAAERGNGIPAQLLAAISRVESGRRDPLTGTMNPWPWSVNAEGQGSFYDTKAEAVAAVRAMQARGVQSIDVGCGQINLMHHPNAFPNLEAGVRSAGECRLRGAVPEGVVRAERRLEQGGGPVPLGDTRAGRGVPAEGARGMARGAASRRAGRNVAAGAGMECDDRRATDRSHARGAVASRRVRRRARRSSCCRRSAA